MTDRKSKLPAPTTRPAVPSTVRPLSAAAARRTGHPPAASSNSSRAGTTTTTTAATARTTPAVARPANAKSSPSSKSAIDSKSRISTKSNTKSAATASLRSSAAISTKSAGRTAASDGGVYNPLHAKLDATPKIGIANFDPRVDFAIALFKAAAAGDLKRLTLAASKLKPELVSITQSWGVANMDRFGEETTCLLRAINTKPTSLECVRLLCRKGVSPDYSPPRSDFPLLKAVMIGSIPIIQYLLGDRKCDVNQTSRIVVKESASSVPKPYDTHEPNGECAVQRAIRVFGNRCVPPPPAPNVTTAVPAAPVVASTAAGSSTADTTSATTVSPAALVRPSGGVLRDRRTETRPYSETQQLLPVLLSHGADVSRLTFRPIHFEDQYDHHYRRSDPQANREPEFKLSCSILMLAFEVDAVDVVRYLVDTYPHAQQQAVSPLPASAVVDLFAATKAGNVAHWIRSADAFDYIRWKGVNLQVLNGFGDNALVSAIRRNEVAVFDLLLPHFDTSDGRALYAALRYRPAGVAHFVRALAARGLTSIDVQYLETTIAQLPVPEKIPEVESGVAYRRILTPLPPGAALLADADVRRTIASQPLHVLFAFVLASYPLTTQNIAPQTVHKYADRYVHGEDEPDAGGGGADAKSVAAQRDGTNGGGGADANAEPLDSENESVLPFEEDGDDGDGTRPANVDCGELSRAARNARFNRTPMDELVLTVCTAYDSGSREYIDKFVAPVLGQSTAVADSSTVGVSSSPAVYCDLPSPLVAIVIGYLFLPQHDLELSRRARSGPDRVRPALPLY